LASQSLNMDLSERVVINLHQIEWQGSPADGVLRKPLEKEFSEHGRTTSLVKFLPGSSFPEHSHPLGEEIFVLEGVFSDEQGDYPAGTYIRNPPNSKHAPSSKQGCVLFVKLDQFDSMDVERVVVFTNDLERQPGIGGLEVLPLHQYGTESSALVYWPSEEQFQSHRHWGGEEILVLKGTFYDEYGVYPQGSWIRNPHLSRHFPFVKEETLIYVKTGHL